MVCLSSDPSIRGNGSTPTREFEMSARTKNNLTDAKCPKCFHVIIDDTCLCSFVEPPVKTDLRMVTPTHYIHDSTTQTLVSYDLRPNELGVWECTCAGFAHRRQCRHIARLLSMLDKAAISAPVAPEKRKVQLEDLFAA